MNFIKQLEDNRGKMFFFSYGKSKLHVVEIKKGFARGGKYHNYEKNFFVILGKIEYQEKNTKTGQEKIQIIQAPSNIHLLPNTAHLMIAIENSIIAYSFNHDEESKNFQEYS